MLVVTAIRDSASFLSHGARKQHGATMDKVRAGLGALGSKLAAVGSSTLDSLEVGKAKLSQPGRSGSSAQAKHCDCPT